MMKIMIALAGVLAGCASTDVAPRFVTAPPVTAVNDRLDTPVAPATRTYVRALVAFDAVVVDPIDRRLALRADQRALGVNALDEVPSSTWFTNRIGVRDVSLAEMREGPASVGSPEAHRPWKVLSTKVGGADIGFIVADARGKRFILKFDKPGYPETETAADAIVARLLWAAGYNVPEDNVVYFTAADLVLDPSAKIKDVFGHARPLRRAELEDMLARIDRAPDGRIRGLASHFLEGTPLGGHPGEGTRPDDPNDRILHELRRDLRGAYAIFGWLDHTDIKEDNSVDMWVTDPDEPARRYVKHYFVDFGSALGASAMTYRDRRSGHEYTIDPASMLASFASAGLHARSWEDREVPELRGVGLYDIASFAPGEWKPNNASYLPFHTTDRLDGFWGAKILVRFTPAQLAAAVDAGRLSDPRSAAYLTKMLVARQRAAARYWFAQVNPLDRAEVVLTAGGYTVCFDDLLLTNRLAPAGDTTRYVVATSDRGGHRLAIQPAVTAAAGGRTCTAPLVLAPDRDAYTIAELHTTRPGFEGSTFVHLARDGGAMRVVGIWRP